MRYFSLIFLLLALTPAYAFTEVKCTERPECWPDGSAMRQGLLQVEKLTQLSKKMVSAHTGLIKLVASAGRSNIPVDSRLLDALKSQQAAWIAYRSAECELVGTLTGAGGSWPSTYANQCEVTLTERRIQRIEEAAQCIKDLDSKTRLFEQNSCLEPLAPLTHR